MRLQISHATTYKYDPPASGVIQILRLTPDHHDGQYVVEWHVDVSVDARLDMRRDAFGNITHAFSHGPLSELVVHASGTIDTENTAGIVKGATELFPPGFFLRRTPLTESDAGMTAAAIELRDKAGASTLDFLHLLMTHLHDTMTFDVDPTNVGTSATEAYALRRGVCQDYAHIFIACARSAGVPARFVSGHFFRADGEVQQGAGHAWAEAHVPDIGWIAFDPANGICATEAHARVAVGLDYLGASPIRGTRYGGGSETLNVGVSVDQAGRQGQFQSQS